MANEVTLTINAQTGAAQNALRGVRGQLQGLGQDAERLNRYSRNLAIAGAAGTALGASILQAGAKMQSMEIALKGVAGSSEAATRQMTSLKELAKSPAFTMETAVMGSVRLQQAGLSAQEAEKAMKGLGAAITASGRGAAELDRATLALSQIALKGKVSQEELLQLTEAGVPAMRILRDQFNLSAKDFENLGKTFEQRGITTTQVINTLGTALQEKFGKAAAEGATSAANAFSNFQDAVFLLKAALGEQLLPTATRFLAAVTALIERVNEAPPALQAVVAWGGAAATALTLLTAVGFKAASMWVSYNTALSLNALVAGQAATGQTALATSTTAATTAAGLGARTVGVLHGALVFLLTPLGLLTAALGAFAAVWRYTVTPALREAASAMQQVSTMEDELIAKGRLVGRSERGPMNLGFWNAIKDMFRPNRGAEDIWYGPAKLAPRTKHGVASFGGGRSPMANESPQPSWAPATVAGTPAVAAFLGGASASSLTSRQTFGTPARTAGLTPSPLEMLGAPGLQRRRPYSLGDTGFPAGALTDAGPATPLKRISSLGRALNEALEAPAKRAKELRDQERALREKQLARTQQQDEEQKRRDQAGLAARVYGLGGGTGLLADILAPAHRGGGGLDKMVATETGKKGQETGRKIGVMVQGLLDQRDRELLEGLKAAATSGSRLRA